ILNQIRSTVTMNKKNFIILITVFLMAVFISACGSSSNQNNATKNASDNEEINAENNNENDEKELKLTKLLPDKKGYIWDYAGSTEYGHSMELEKIEESAKKVDYIVEEEVEDASGGESENDFSLDLTYTVTADKLTQNVDSEMMMDNNISEIELIKTPLSEGNEWIQTQKNSDGEEITLESSIDSIENDDGQDIYTVIYEDSDSDYYERREIKEGVGVISFESSDINDDNDSEDMPMKYEINYDATGYSDNKEKNDENNEKNDENSEVLSEFSDEEIEYARVWLEVIDNKDT